MINLPWPQQRRCKHGQGGEPLQTLAEREEKRRRICRHSACSLDLVHIVTLSDGPVKERERERELCKVVQKACLE